MDKPPQFPLPDNWEPEGTWCATIRIPADEQYIPILLGWLHELTMSRNHARDPSEQGAATVSRTWQNALDSVPIIISEDCVSWEESMAKIRFRPKPGQPWIEQYKYDDEPLWYDKNIQAHWPASAISTPTDPPADNAEAQADAAIIIRGGHQHIVGKILDLLALGVARADGINALVGEMSGFAPDQQALRDAVGEAWDMVSDLPTPTANDYIADAPEQCAMWSDTWQKLLRALQDNAIAEAIGQVGAYLGAQNAADVQKVLNDVMETLGNNAQEYAAGYAGGGGGSAFADCTWSVELDFTVGQYGFSLVPIADPPGVNTQEYLDTLGFWADYGLYLGNPIAPIEVSFSFDDTIISRFSVLHFNGTNHSSNSVGLSAKLNGAVVDSYTRDNAGQTSWTELVLTSPGELVDQVFLSTNIQDYTNARIIGFRAEGLGYNPFWEE